MGCGFSHAPGPSDINLQARPALQQQGLQGNIEAEPLSHTQSSSAQIARSWTPPGEATSLQGYKSNPKEEVPSSRPIRGPDGRTIKTAQPFVNREGLLKALETAAGYLERKQLDYTLVTLGGAVNTILLQTREATQDVDFFAAHRCAIQDGQCRAHAAHDDDAIQILKNIAEAAEFTFRQIGANTIGNEWLNNRVIAFIPPALSQQLVRRAHLQNVVVFGKPGLTLLAAPWSFSFTSKVERLLQSNFKDFDMVDAVHYLHQYIISHGCRPVTVALLNQWANEYGRRSSNYVIKEINTVYRDHYHTDAVQELIGTPDFRPYAKLKSTGR